MDIYESRTETKVHGGKEKLGQVNVSSFGFEITFTGLSNKAKWKQSYI